MKINYDSKDISFKEYNVAQGIAAFKKIYIKNKETKIKSYITRFLELGFMYIICFLILIFLAIKLDVTFFKIIAKFSFAIGVFCILFSILSVACSYLNFKKSNFSNGTIIIDDKGIVDDTKEDLIISYKWNGIKLLVIYKDVLIVIGNAPMFILTKLENKEKVKKEILKYYKEEKILFYL